jgi:hypothetical protein
MGIMRLNQLAAPSLLCLLSMSLPLHANGGDKITTPLLQIEEIEHLSGDLYRITVDGGSLVAAEAAASNLASLTNLDAFSEDWRCSFTKGAGDAYFTAHYCTPGPDDAY